jgi:hypothetical protein
VAAEPTRDVAVRAAPDLPVIVRVDGATEEAIRKKSGYEKRVVAEPAHALDPVHAVVAPGSQQGLGEGLLAGQAVGVLEYALVEQLHEVSGCHWAGLKLDLLDGSGEQFSEERAR